MLTTGYILSVAAGFLAVTRGSSVGLGSSATGEDTGSAAESDNSSILGLDSSSEVGLGSSSEVGLESSSAAGSDRSSNTGLDGSSEVGLGSSSGEGLGSSSGVGPGTNAARRGSVRPTDASVEPASPWPINARLKYMSRLKIDKSLKYQTKCLTICLSAACIQLLLKLFVVPV